MNITEYVNALAESAERWTLLGMAQRYAGQSYVRPVFDDPMDAALRERDRDVLDVADLCARVGWSEAGRCATAGDEGQACHAQAVAKARNMYRAAVQAALYDVEAGVGFVPEDRPASVNVLGADTRDGLRLSVHRAAQNRPTVDLPLSSPAPDPPKSGSNTALTVALWIGALSLAALGIWRLTKNPYIWEGGLLTSGRRPNPSYRDFIRGEWWIMPDGDSLYADQDIGDQGHESLAIGYMINSDRVREILDERGIDYEDYVEIGSDDASGAYMEFESELSDAPADIVHEAPSGAPREQVWEDVKEDVRGAFAKHWGAIMAHGADFAAWRIGPEQIEAIQGFLYDEVDKDDLADPDAEIFIEQYEDNRSVSVPVSEFLNAKHPRDLWG